MKIEVFDENEYRLETHSKIYINGLMKVLRIINFNFCQNSKYIPQISPQCHRYPCPTHT